MSWCSPSGSVERTRLRKPRLPREDEEAASAGWLVVLNTAAEDMGAVLAKSTAATSLLARRGSCWRHRPAKVSTGPTRPATAWSAAARDHRNYHCAMTVQGQLQFFVSLKLFSECRSKSALLSVTSKFGEAVLIRTVDHAKRCLILAKRCFINALDWPCRCLRAAANVRCARAMSVRHFSRACWEARCLISREPAIRRFDNFLLDRQALTLCQLHADGHTTPDTDRFPCPAGPLPAGGSPRRDRVAVRDHGCGLGQRRRRTEQSDRPGFRSASRSRCCPRAGQLHSEHPGSRVSFPSDGDPGMAATSQSRRGDAC